MSLVRCGVCSHARRAVLEEAAARQGADFVELAREFGVAASVLERHVEQHPRAPKSKKTAKATIPPSPRESRSAKARAPRQAPSPPVVDDAGDEDAPVTSRSPSAPTARHKVDELLGALKRLADGIGEDATVAQRIAVFRASVAPIRLLGQLTGELGASDATVASSPHYRRIRSAIVEALKEHPAALKAVEQALSRLEPGGAAEEAAA